MKTAVATALEAMRTDGDADDCDYNCAFVAPYGFVPEADCPVHDARVTPPTEE